VKSQLGSLTIVLVSAAAAAAQYPPGYGYGYGGGGYGHASTLEEGIQRGYADVVRSTGMANLLNSQAAQGFETARSQYLDNRMKATQTYFEMRRYNTEARRADRPSPLSQEGYVRLARQQAPAQLSTSQLDPLTGTITWTMTLRKPEYAALRAPIEKLFHERASGYADASAIDKAIDTFETQLKADLPMFAPNDYLAGKNFLASLKYAAHSPI
jgi:hypothetical protein